MVPVLGPWIEISSLAPEAQLFTAIDGVAQVATLGLFASGFLFSKKYFIHDDQARTGPISISAWAVAPHVFEAGKPGFTLHATFR